MGCINRKRTKITDSKIILPENIPVWNIEDLVPYNNNPRTHSEQQIAQLVESMREFGFTNPILVDGDTREIIAGHGRLQAAQRLGLLQVPVVVLRHLDEAKRHKLIIADNQLALNAGWDMDLLATEIAALNEMGENLDSLGFDDEFIKGILDTKIEIDGEESEREIGSLFTQFGVPPFSIFDVRKGYWQARKKWWKEHIKENGESRTGTLFAEGTFIAELGTVSILDPVLCEIAAGWWGLGKGMKCIDPFAGDTSFGFVAGYLGCEFTGIELRTEQAAINQKRCDEYNLPAKYICDDGQNVLNHAAPESQDFLFSCPPYFDLEVYSDLPNDASNQESYEDYLKIIDTAFTGAIKTLKQNRFAVIVVANVRDKKTQFYRNIVGDVIRIFENNGMGLYNDAILMDALGSAPRRAAHNMRTRKLTKTHQNVLVFYKGEAMSIKDTFTADVFIDHIRDFMEDYNGETEDDNGAA